VSKKQNPANISTAKQAEVVRPESNRRQSLLIYSAAAVVSLVIVFFVLQLWRADFNIPIAYEWRDLKQGGEALDPIGSNDVLLFCSLFKGMRENGWFLHNPALGAPGELDFHDYPIGENLQFFAIKFLEWLTPTYGMTANIYFLLGFPLCMVSTLFVLRQFKIGYALAVAGALLFTFAPYHFLRGQQHMWLATYFTVPLMVLVVFWVLDGEPLFPIVPGKKGFPIGITRKGVTAVLICALVASTGIYYSLFGFFLMFVAGLLRCRTWKWLVPPAILAGVIFVTLFLNTLPTILYQSEHGKNPEVPNRYPAQVEYFALRITQMLAPVMHHRVPALAKFSSAYYESAPLVTENATACLGLVASAGFLVLLIWLLGLRWPTAREPTLTALSAMNVCCVLLATMGGFCSLLAFGVSPVIRCFNRISIFIAFFALLAVLFAFEKLRERWAASGGFGWGFSLVLLVGIGLADQTTEFFVPAYTQSAATFHSDDSFVRRIEEKVPPGAMIYQLPFMPFPEGPPGEMALLRGYLHSKSLRWSFGAMTGRETDTWNKRTVWADGNFQRIVQVLIEKGFKGIYVDRQLLRQSFREPEKIEGFLKQTVDATPIASEDGRLAFYNLTKPPAPAGQ
jgi:phosphoglycerol transferase